MCKWFRMQVNWNLKNPNASLQSLHPKESYRQNVDNAAAPVLFPSIMQRRHPECSADSCTLSASIAKSSHQTCGPGRLPHCNFAAILSVMWHLAVDTELRKQTHSADSLESSTQTTTNDNSSYSRFPFNTGFFNKICSQARYFQHQAEFLVSNLHLSAAVTRWRKEVVNDVTFLFLPWKYWNKETFRLSFVVRRYCQRRKCDLFVAHLQKHGGMTSQEKLLALKL